MIELKHPVTLIHGAIEDALPLIPDDSMHACISDPPYALSMGGGTSGWDNYSMPEFAAWCESWGRELLRVLKPGGWAVLFGSARTWHRLTQGLEDAGFDVIDSIIWHYPSGFMRSLDLEFRLEKAGLGDAAARMAGRGTSLHSRHEPAILLRAPLKGSLIDTVSEQGTATVDLGMKLPNGTAPPNVLVQHSPFCGGEDDNIDCVDGCPVPLMGPNMEYFPSFRFESKPNRQERPRVQVFPGEGTKKLSTLGQVRMWECSVCHVLTRSYMGSGSVYSNKPHPVCACAQYVPVTENFSSQISHNTVKPLSLMRWLVRILTFPGDTVLEPFAGSGSTVESCVYENRNVVAIERDLSSIELTRVRLRRTGCYRIEDGANA